MEYHLVGFSQLTEAERKHLAVLHHSVMHTLLSDLGLPMVSRYYQVAQADPSVLGICAVNPSGEILGWAVGSPDPDKINAQLRSPLSWFSLQMLRLCLTRPLAVWQLIASVLSTAPQVENKNGSIELTYVGVSSGRRGMGVGRALLHAFVEESRSKGYRSVVLSVEKENLAAVAMYEKAGFRVIRTFTEGRYRRHRMELVLA